MGRSDLTILAGTQAKRGSPRARVRSDSSSPSQNPSSSTGIRLQLYLWATSLARHRREQYLGWEQLGQRTKAGTVRFLHIW